MTGLELKKSLEAGKTGKLFSKLYGEKEIGFQKKRYSALIDGMLKNEPDWFPVSEFPEVTAELRVFSAPGRTELGGNHTDHNHGKVLAASIQMDSAAVVAPRNDKKVFYRSTSYPDVIVDLTDTSPRNDERGTTEALIRGIAAEFEKRGREIRGFTANADSTVLKGSGLSSSAAVEVSICKIFDCLCGDGKTGALELAQIGQKAENNYFGKPCGLMDQTACASGGAVAIDFADTNKPFVKEINFDPAATGFFLCVVDTGGNHADLTPEYASIPNEMKAAASFFGKDTLREIDENSMIANFSKLREKAGDRALLRAMHFFNENRRVDAMLSSLKKINSSSGNAKNAAMDDFLSLVNSSGDSSWEILQNVYAPSSPEGQGLSLALSLTKDFIKNHGVRGACRVHGGGFAGTIQVYLPHEVFDLYRKLIESCFGKDALTLLRIRPEGALELKFYCKKL